MNLFDIWLISIILSVGANIIFIAIICKDLNYKWNQNKKQERKNVS